MTELIRTADGIRALIFTGGIVTGTCGAVMAQTAVPGQPVDEQQPAAWNAGATRTIRLFPAGDIYPVYVADPQRPTNTLVQEYYTRTRVPETGSPRWLLAAGGRFGMVRIDSRAPGGRFWQLSIEAGLDALFDSRFKNDALGWDGNYGLTVTTATSKSPVAFKLAVLHLSAHLGDEYEQRTDLARINYTREELALGVAWRINPHWRAYGEMALAFLMRSDGQEPGRLQSGLEYEARPTVFGGRMALYIAADLSALEERDWRLDTAVQAGLVTRSGGHTARFFAQWYDGRGTLGQFVGYSEASFSLGLRIDL